MKKSKSTLVANSKKRATPLRAALYTIIYFFLLSHLANESRTDP